MVITLITTGILSSLIFSYNHTGATPRSGSYYGKVNKTIAAYNFGCVNTENSLADCNYVRYTYDQGKLFALNTSVAGLYCTPPDPTIPPTVCPVTPTLSPSPVCKTGDVQLANGQNSGEGRLMYCYNNQWSPFCSLDGNTASVACKYKGYSTASKIVHFNLANMNLPFSDLQVHRYLQMENLVTVLSTIACLLTSLVLGQRISCQIVKYHPVVVFQHALTTLGSDVTVSSIVAFFFKKHRGN